MTKRMLIDATHAEETRVVVLDGNRLEDFDVETSTKKQLKGNIYLAKIVRVEPSLQAAFVEYGGGRHGFLAFGEIHPDYYQIPVADRERLIRLQAEEARAEEAAEEAADAAEASGQPLAPQIADLPPPAELTFSDSALPDETGGGSDSGVPEPRGPQDQADLDVPIEPLPAWEGVTRMPDLPAEQMPPEQGGLIDAGLPDEIPLPNDSPPETGLPEVGPAEVSPPEVGSPEVGFPEVGSPDVSSPESGPWGSSGKGSVAEPGEASFADTMPGDARLSDASFPEANGSDGDAGGIGQLARDRGEPNSIESGNIEPNGIEPNTIETVVADAPPPETVGGESESGEEGRERRPPSRYLRNYKIQEVIRRRQILLVQVVKEERGTKGAALTTYISLAGRFSVLMPNSPRGGGISRKITSAADRRRLKEITNELDIPDGMGLIVRTAGANRPKPEIKRDCEYLLRLWDDIRETTMRSVAPALIHEEASLIKRAIRDVYSRDIDEVLVDGEEGWRAARDVMRMLMPTHARKVISWRDHPTSGGQPLFASQQVEAQLDAMMSPNVQLRSGGYLVINQTEALVAIDVNSGRSTRERGIEETALRTNLEAADEVARQLRLRDLAGLIVIDFIDMEAKKHNLMVERRLKEALKIDRARIQVGQISHFGLMEMSRQRLRPSLAENSFVVCPQCGGAGHVRSTESAAIHVLRGIDEEGAKRRAAEIMVNVAPSIAMYILNYKRDRLLDIERRYGMQVLFNGDASLIVPQMRIDRLRAALPPAPGEALPPPTGLPIAAPARVAPAAVALVEEVEEEEVAEEDEVEAAPAVGNGAAAISEEESEARRKRRRRRRRGGRRDDASPPGALPEVAELGALQPDFVIPDERSVIDPAILDLDAGIAVVIGTGAETAGETAAPADLPPADLPGGQTEDGPVAGSQAAPVGGSAAEPGQPGEAAPSLDAEAEEARARRRGRRGGRRRRRDGDEGGPSDGAVAEGLVPEPPYSGPTPANPFGGTAFDIYDVMEQAEQMPQPLAAIAMPPPLLESTEPMPAPDAVAAAPDPDPEPTADELPQRGLHLVAPKAAPAHADPVASGPAETGPPEPLIKPVVIDSSAPLQERKRGWWRR